MNDTSREQASRWGIALLLITVGAAGLAARVLAVQSDDGRVPFLSANDRSRWATIRALGDHGTYELDQVIFVQREHGPQRDPRWYSIDLVRHAGPDGRLHYYSSKPPLYPTFLAGQYWLLKQTLGVEFEEEPFFPARVLLLLNNVFPLVLAWLLLAHWLPHLTRDPWTGAFVLAAAVFGTLLSSFAVSLNNHLPAAVTALAAAYCAWRVFQQERAPWHWFAGAGLAAALTAANELPALSFFCLAAALLAWRSPLKTAAAFLPPAAAVAGAFFLTNYWAHGDWRPAYGHRAAGPVVAQVGELPEEELRPGPVPAPLRRALENAGRELPGGALLEEKIPDIAWRIVEPPEEYLFELRRGTAGWALHAWDDWYDYPLSYWRDDRRAGVDRGEPSRALYAFHVLLGHHGWFSLTPLWLAAVAGMAFAWRERGGGRLLVLFAALLWLVCVAFYIGRPLIDRNYGGVSCGPRWLIWLTPFWLLMLPAAVERLSPTRWGRALALALLAVSVVSAVYPGNNPWTHPWLFDYWTSLGWIDYP